MGKVSFTSYLILGASCGSFIMAYQIASYIVNSYRFPFLSTITKPFVKYTINNFIFPLSFIITYIVCNYRFQIKNEESTTLDIVYQSLGFLVGSGFFYIVSLTYFFAIGSDFFKLLILNNEPFKSKNPISRIRKGIWKKHLFEHRKGEKIEVLSYLNHPFELNNIHSEKIRIVNNSLTSSLNTDISVEIPTSEQTPKDTNIVSIYFSPQEMIDSDIYNQLGYFDIDDYIGDPADQNLSYYNDLRVIQYQYWKKYKNSNNLPVLLKLLSVYDYSFFDQLKQLLPARVVLDNSIKIRPNVLERSKITILDDVVVTTPMYDKTIDAYNYINLTGDYPVYDGTIDYTDTLEKAGVYNYSSSKYLPGSGVVNMMVRFEPTGAAVLQNTLSLTRQVFYPIYSTEASASIGKFNSSSYYRAAEVQDYNYSLASFRKRNFEGTKISAAGYNVSSNDLPDKSPVISVTIVKPGTIRNNPAIPPKPPTSPVKSPAPPVSTTNPNANGRTPIGYNSRGFNLG
jgi:hypothetical protein